MPCWKSCACRNRGFTLIELLLVLVLLGISSAVAVVSVDRLVSRWQERSIATQVLSLLKMARVSAMSGGHAVTVVINPQKSEISASGVAATSKILHITPPYQLSTAESSELRKVFWPDGSMDSGAFELTREGRGTIQGFVMSGATQTIRFQ